jgi:hypothetical protein
MVTRCVYYCAIRSAIDACFLLFRMHSLYDRSQRVLVTMLALSIADFAVQMSANHLVTCKQLARSKNPRSLDLC